MELSIETAKAVTAINYLGPHQIETTGGQSWNLTECLKDEVFVQATGAVENNTTKRPE